MNKIVLLLATASIASQAHGMTKIENSLTIGGIFIASAALGKVSRNLRTYFKNSQEAAQFSFQSEQKRLDAEFHVDQKLIKDKLATEPDKHPTHAWNDLRETYRDQQIKYPQEQAQRAYRHAVTSNLRWLTPKITTLASFMTSWALALFIQNDTVVDAYGRPKSLRPAYAALAFALGHLAGNIGWVDSGIKNVSSLSPSLDFDHLWS